MNRNSTRGGRETGDKYIVEYDPILKRNVYFRVKDGYAYSVVTGYKIKIEGGVKE